MKREQLSTIICNIDDRYIAEAYQFDPDLCARSSERIVHMKKKRMITFALVAALMLSLSIAVYAAVSMVNSPQVAERVAKEEIERWKEIGLLNPEVAFEGEADRIVEFQEQKGDERWYGRFFAHSYDVRFYLGPVSWGNQTPSADLVQRKYGCSLTIDTLSGNNAAEVHSSKKNDKPEMCQHRKPHHKTDLHNYGATESVGLHTLHNFGELFLKLAIGIV